MIEEKAVPQTTYVAPTVSDGAAVAQFVRQAGSLEPNTTYAYLLLCHHFADTCVVAKQGDRVVGVLLAYRLPADPEAVFVWQVGTAADTRGQGVASTMLTTLKERVQKAGVRRFDVTIAPSNEASRALFRRWAEKMQLPISEASGFEKEHFGGEEHEPEPLLTIGPF